MVTSASEIILHTVCSWSSAMATSGAASSTDSCGAATCHPWAIWAMDLILKALLKGIPFWALWAYNASELWFPE